MNRSFARRVDHPEFRGVGAATYVPPSDEVKISSSKLYAGGVACAFGGMAVGAAIVALLKPSFVMTGAAMLGPLALIPGAAAIGYGYYTLWTGGDRLEYGGA